MRRKVFYTICLFIICRLSAISQSDTIYDLHHKICEITSKNGNIVYFDTLNSKYTIAPVLVIGFGDEIDRELSDSIAYCNFSNYFAKLDTDKLTFMIIASFNKNKLNIFRIVGNKLIQPEYDKIKRIFIYEIKKGKFHGKQNKLYEFIFVLRRDKGEIEEKKHW